jgi:hypothetical protein
MCISSGTSPSHCRIWAASPSHSSTSDGLSPPSFPPPLYSEVYEDEDYPEAHSPNFYDDDRESHRVDDDDDDDRESHHVDDDDDDDNKDEEAPYVLSQDTSEDKDSEHVSIRDVF